jgi:hypothetical protein
MARRNSEELDEKRRRQILEASLRRRLRSMSTHKGSRRAATATAIAACRRQERWLSWGRAPNVGCATGLEPACSSPSPRRVLLPGWSVWPFRIPAEIHSF